MKTYSIAQTDSAGVIPMENPLWHQAEKAEIDSFAWDDGTGYRPCTSARLLAGKDDSLFRIQ